eukprot:gene12160-5942_t
MLHRVTRGFATGLRVEREMMVLAIETSTDVAQALADYDIDEARIIIKHRQGELPTGIRQ